MTTTLVVLPRFPNDRTGTGQRSRLLIDAAVAAGPTHVLLLDGSALSLEADALPDTVSVSGLFSARLTPKGLLSRRLGGTLRLLSPEQNYAPDLDLRAALLDLVARHGIDTVIFRYARLYAAAGIVPGDGPRVLVDVDDRDDQKYRARLEQRLGPRLAQAPVFRRQLTRLAQILQTRLSAASHVWFVAPEDVWPLAPATTSLLPNVPYREGPPNGPPVSQTGPVALFVGIHDHAPNRDGIRWFLKQIWGGVRRRVPEAQLRIVGRGDWASMASEFPDAAGVAFVGEVDDLAAEYATARLAICPLRDGGGSKIKLIEAAAFARPVVATPHALRGFLGDGLEHIVQADAAGVFGEATAAFLADPAHAARTGAALHRWQTRSYSRTAFITTVTQAMSA